MYQSIRDVSILSVTNWITWLLCIWCRGTNNITVTTPHGFHFLELLYYGLDYRYHCTGRY